MSNFRVIFFDVDGTLVEQTHLMEDGIKAVLSDAGYGVDFDFRPFTGNTDYQIFKTLLKEKDLSAEKNVDAAIEMCNNLERKVIHLLQSYELNACPGVPELLLSLTKMPIKLGLLTGNIEAVVAPKLLKAGISPDYFLFGGFGDSSENRTEVAKKAFSKAESFFGGKLDPQDVLVVGDTPRDVTCARAIGAKVLAVATGSYSQAELMQCEPNFVLENLTNMDKVKMILDSKYMV